MQFPFGYIVALLLIQVYPFKGQFNSTASKQIHILHFKIKKINEFDDSLTLNLQVLPSSLSGFIGC